MKSSEIIQLERDRSKLVRTARDVLREIKNCTEDKKLSELEARHDEIMHNFELIELDIREAKLTDEGADNRPDQSGEGRGIDDGRGIFAVPSLWTDEKGNEITVLENNQRMAKRHDLGIGFGDYVRAQVNGPRNDAETRALSETTSSQGGFTVPTPLASEFIDRLRANTAAIRAGARTVPMASNTLSMARLDTDPTVTWRAENALIGDSDPVFSSIILDAKSCAGMVKVSRELLSDSVNINEILLNAFVQVMARELDRVALWNSGADTGPIGVAATPGINEVVMGTNGAALTNHDRLLDTIYQMKLNNAADATAAIMHPRTELTLGKLKTTDGYPMPYPDMLASIPRYATTSASITETQGTATNTSSILFGNFRELFIGIRNEVSITILNERYADYGQVGFLVWMRADVQLAHKASFSRLRGILP
jgi:HK97 family phage major capsid protein